MIPGGRLPLVNRRVSEIRATDWRVKRRREGEGGKDEECVRLIQQRRKRNTVQSPRVARGKTLMYMRT